jgi:serine/threonine-protein kinase
VTGPSEPSNHDAPFLPPNWRELAPLLDELLDAPPAERAARVRQLGNGDAALQRQLEQLLAESERSMPLLDAPAVQRFSGLTGDDSETTLPEVLSGRYRIGRELGRGGMASVYLAHDLKHGRDVAVKIIRSDLAASLGHDRFLREIEIAARLRHPNIVPLFDSGEAGDALFFVMPYEDGLSLREQVRRGGALPIPEALSVLRDVARALAYAHERGVVHRDVKPDNVMLSGGAAVVTDFGIAKAIAASVTQSDGASGDPETGMLTQAGTIIGTPAYMAPEQATGDSSIDHRADIYSFGCLAYEVFTGHPPFQEQKSHLLIAAHIATTPRPIAELRDDVPANVGALLARCLAKAPADRPQSARELLAVLDGPSASVTAPPTVNEAPARRSPRVAIWSVAIAVVALATLGSYIATRTASAGAPITLAVLPFANIAGDSAMDLVGAGLADEVASALSRVPGIVVTSRSGARRYLGQLAPDVTEAGARLKADYLVTAVVRQDRGRWILMADFARAADAQSLWENRFQFDPNEQAAVADSVAGDLTAKLRATFPRIVGLAPARSRYQQTSNPEASRLYVKGKELVARRGQSVKEAVDVFRRSTREDSLFAPAYAGLSMALALMPWFHKTPPAQVHDELVAAAHRALALDSTQSMPHVALGVDLWQATKLDSAAIEMATAVRLDPSNVEARVQYGRLLVTMGRSADALTQFRAARALDPASALVLSHMANAYLLSGQIDSALAETRRALETDSTNFTTNLVGSQVYLAANRPREAHGLALRSPVNSYPRGYQLAKSGDVDGARQLLQQLDAGPPQWGDATMRAFTYLGLGDTTHAFSELERATDANELWSQSMAATDRIYDLIRNTPRFRVLLERVGLGPYLSLIVKR